ncbi:hypothetical protein DTO212C5_6883 [Paecilomyces variotii]|nr:hypothetical protein DTO212C5_6883 [Paecilomyces variotii]
MAALQTAKKDLRRKVRDVLLTLPKDSIASQSTIVTNQLLSLPEYRNAKRIGVYLSMPSGEISTTSIVQNALKSGKEVFIPYIHTTENAPAKPKSSVMDMLALNSLEEFESLKPDKWGIPSLDEASISDRENCLGGYGVASPWHPHTARKSPGLDLIVMPGMAFDKSLRRLGHGKGYYDRFLARYSTDEERKKSTPQRPFLVALALKEQVLQPPEEIPVSEHDWPVDAVIVGDGQIISPRS